ncbi:L-amino-acid oxidase [Biomphalaria glabrata]|nr:L-amino-acid oxidase-like; partial [Biomphalaria glabrata]KAI8764508.1 L-amino-acid oxidase [Biomphalaria glabrata]
MDGRHELARVVCLGLCIFAIFAQEPCSRSVDIAIVGAGPAGSYSAYKLRNKNLSIELFEFSNRVGGRLYTATLSGMSDVLLEMGGMRFYKEVHSTVFQLMEELGLSYGPFNEIRSNLSDARYYIRGNSLTYKEMLSESVPFQLSPEEKANQGRLVRYYLEKLTGFNGDELTEEILESLNTTSGRKLYEIPPGEALVGIATSEGREMVKALSKFESLVDLDCSLCIWETELYHDKEISTVRLGMSSIPRRLTRKFLKTNDKHKLTYNRRLMSVSDRQSDGYHLLFQHTETADGVTTNLPTNETVCAQKVVLALPKFALQKINWSPLREQKYIDHLNSVRLVFLSKVFLTYPTPWWRTLATNKANVTYSDLHFSQFFDWGRSNESGEYVMMASYADHSKTEFLAKLNANGPLVNGSEPGDGKVSQELLDTIIDELTQAFNINRNDIPEPIRAFSKFWNSDPFGGAIALWRAGYRYEDVIPVVQRPSEKDEVYVVGSDFSKHHRVLWTEGALSTVDRMLENYVW